MQDEARRLWRGPALDSTPATVRWLRRHHAPLRDELTETRPWTPYSAMNPRWGSGSLLAVARAHHAAVASLNDDGGRSLPRSSSGPLDARRGGPMPRCREPTMLFVAHTWPPHRALTPRGLPPWSSVPPRPPPVSPQWPSNRVRSTLRDHRATSVHGLLRGSSSDLKCTTSAEPTKEYKSPRPSPSRYGLESTHAGVGRPGFFCSS